MAMVPFLLEILLRSPIILGRRTMLDSLMIGVARERFGDDAVHAPLPLQRSHGIAHGSQMFAGVPEMAAIRSVTYIQSFIRVLSNDEQVTMLLDRQPPPSSMSHGSGPLSNVESSYITHNIPRVYFLGVGDIDRVRAGLLTMCHIGTMAHKGHGEVEHYNITEIAADPTWFGIVGRYDNQLIVLRPVPKRLAHLLPSGTSGIDNHETWDYPYIPAYPTAVVEPCLVPPFTTHAKYFHRETIRALCSL
jgi:hypothetical protein